MNMFEFILGEYSKDPYDSNRGFPMWHFVS
jgi:hypothetical protein